MNKFDQATRVAPKLLSPIKDMSVGIKPMLVKNSQGDWETVDLNSRVLLAAITLILVNGGSQDNWLASALNTALEGAAVVDLGIATNINRLMIQEGVINRRSTRIPLMRNGRMEMRKLWEITDYVKEMINAIELEEKKTTRSIGEKRQAGWTKGESYVSEAVKDSLRMLDAVPYLLHANTERFCEIEHDVIDTLPKSERDAKRRDIEALEDEFALRGNEPFQFTHRNDTRGRTYALGGSISYQGSKLQKACITFAENIDPDWDEIAVYLARERGNKKRYEWALKDGYEIVKNPQSIKECAIVSDPGRAIIRLDGTCNGVQWMSALTGDTKGALLTNVIGSSPNDLYSHINDKFNMDGRNQVKGMMVPMIYGASEVSIARSVGLPRKEVLDLIEEIEKEVPSISSYMEFVKRKAKAAVRKGDTQFMWELPDGLMVVHNYETNTDILNIGNFSAAVGENVPDEIRLVNALAPNIIHSVDAYHMRLIVRNCDFPVSPVHDSFGVHSAHIKELRGIIRETFKQILEEDVLNKIFKDIGFGHKWKTIDPRLITNDYMFM